jgi:phosphoadenosine phosphosulfate reductase
MSAEDKNRHPLEVMRRAKDAGITKAIVAVSCGKDSVATLSMCCEHLGSENVRCYFMYFVPGLSFQEKYLTYLEGRFGVTIMRLPHWGLRRLFQDAALRFPVPPSKVPKAVKIRDIENYVRVNTGFAWIATGERAADSMERQAQIKKCNGVNHERLRFYPIAYWSNAAVFNYLKSQRIVLPGDYTATGSQSFGSLWAEQLIGIRDRFPEDYEKVKQMFPFADAQILRYQLRKARGHKNVR